MLDAILFYCVLHVRFYMDSGSWVEDFQKSGRKMVITCYTWGFQSKKSGYSSVFKRGVTQTMLHPLYLASERLFVSSIALLLQSCWTSLAASVPAHDNHWLWENWNGAYWWHHVHLLRIKQYGVYWETMIVKAADRYCCYAKNEVQKAHPKNTAFVCFVLSTAHAWGRTITHDTGKELVYLAVVTIVFRPCNWVTPWLYCRR